MKDSLRKFLGNKNTVTIIGVLLAVVVLWIGYNARINQAVKLIRVPYAKANIQPKTEIKKEHIGFMNVAQNFVGNAEYYSKMEDILGKYSNYNTMIAEGSLFYKALLIDKKELPDYSFMDLKDGYTVINYKVDMDSTYANSMMPGSKINIYFKSGGKLTNNKEEPVRFGKFISNIEILDVKDSEGQHVFENSEEARIPAYMLFAIPEDMHILLRKALYLSSLYNVELLLVPNTQEPSTAKDSVYVSSKDIQAYINERTTMVSVDQIMSSTADKASAESNNKKKNNN